MKTKIIISANSSWNIFNFRHLLLVELIESGFEVVVVAPEDEFSGPIEKLGCKFINLKMDRKSKNPFLSFWTCWRYYKIFKTENPRYYLGFTIKPNIFGSLAAQLLNINVINNISGLGSGFLAGGVTKFLIVLLYKFALRRSSVVFFQNSDDANLFIKERIVEWKQVRLLPGSGVDLEKFKLTPLPNAKKMRFLLISRMLKDKGIVEFVEAAKIVRTQKPGMEMCLLGPIDDGNPSSVTLDNLRKWEYDGIIRYLGGKNDVRDDITKSHCVVLPSYREGTPRTLLEASAMGRPIITTNVPGCRQVIEDGKTGYLCEPYDANDLAEKILKFSELSFLDMREMGTHARIRAENLYDERFILIEYLNAIKS